MATPCLTLNLNAALDATTVAGVVWNDWNYQYATCSSNATTIWQDWNASYSVVTTGSVWTAWNYEASGDSVSIVSANYVWTPPTDDELAAAISRANETKIRREAAEARARSLLIENLDEAQRLQFESAKTFEVLSRDGKRIYQVRYGKAGNVFLMKNGKAVSKFCIHPEDARIPIEDVMLVQKLMIEGAEEEFLRIANRSAA